MVIIVLPIGSSPAVIEPIALERVQRRAGRPLAASDMTTMAPDVPAGRSLGLVRVAYAIAEAAPASLPA